MESSPRVDRPLVSVRYLASVLGMRPRALRELAAHAYDHYEPFDLLQSRNGKTKLRHIDNPLDALKKIQHRIKRRLIDPVTLPAFVTGGVRGRSTQMNAALHVGQEEVVALDFHDFFPRITSKQVARMWSDRFQASTEVAWILTRLTTYQNHLPQGSPASNGVANLVVLPLLVELDDACRGSGMAASAYVDDVSISGRGARQMLNPFARAASRHGFRIARRKTRIMPAHVQQRVTGLVVNRKVSSGRARARTAWHALIDARYGAHEAKSTEALRGLVTHIKTTCPGQARRLEALLREVCVLRASAGR